MVERKTCLSRKKNTESEKVQDRCIIILYPPLPWALELFALSNWDTLKIQAVTFPKYRENMAIMFDYSSNPWFR